MRELLLSDSFIIIYELVLLLIIVIFIIKFTKEKNNKLKNEDANKHKQQQNTLDQRLANSKGNYK